MIRALAWSTLALLLAGCAGNEPAPAGGAAAQAGAGQAGADKAGADKAGADKAGAAEKPPANRSVAAEGNPDCHMLNRPVGRLRPGTNVPLHMLVVNTGNWCFSGFGLSGVDGGGSSIVNQPSNGELRMFAKGEGVVFGYRPKPGYAGSDAFLIAMPTGYGYEINLAVTVSVDPRH